MAHGKKVWLIADGYYDSHSNGIYPSHESVCVLNTSDEDARVDMTLYFEDREPMPGFSTRCPARRTHHIRMDKLTDGEGRHVPLDLCYAILVESSVEIVVQYSRCDTAQAELTLMTTIAYPIG